MQSNSNHSATPPPYRRQQKIFLCAYLILFALFVVFNIFAPEAMSATEIPLGPDHVLTLWGTNFAVTSGIGIVLTAVFLTWLDQRRD